MKKLLPLILFLFASATASAVSDTARALFIGNSYVQVNNLPDIIARIAANRGDVLIRTDASVGGSTFQNHLANTHTLAQITQKDWDYVALQEQSQLPAFPDGQVARDCYPYARKLDSIVHLANPCANTVFYMTWGRKNGDAGNCASFLLICTYNGMDSLLRARYTIMAQSNHAVISPVGAAWHKMRDLHPATELYQADESHPSEAGSYLAACTFYTILFKKTPATITYDYNLRAMDASDIRQIVKMQVWDSLAKWYQYRTAPMKPSAGFSQSLSGRTAQFSNTSMRAIGYQWTFGDGSSDTAASPHHTYAANGSYAVRFIAVNCDGVRDTMSRQLTIGATGAGFSNAARGINIYPNPAKERMRIECTELPAGVALYDGQGRVCRSIANPADREVTLELAGLPARQYFLRIVYPDGTAVAQMVAVNEYRLRIT